MNTKFKRIQCIDRALDILNAIKDGKLTTVNAIASQVGLTASTVYNIVKTLESRGFIGNENGRYEIGAKLGLLASNWDLAGSLPTLTKPILEEINSRTGESVCVTILKGLQAEIITLMNGTRQVSVQFLHRTWNYPLNLGTGRLLVALGNPADWPLFIQKHLQDGPKNFDESDWNTQKWQNHLERLRDQDYVILRISPSDGEASIGVVAVPLRSANRSLIAAIGCSCPNKRATDKHLRFIKDAIISGIANNSI